MKKVFDNKQLAHVWASQSQDQGSNPSGSMYFRGPTIFSYGNHFPMAKIYSGFALVNSNGYSVTTAKHLSLVKTALHGRVRYVEVPYPDDLNNADNENHLLNQISDLVRDIFKGKMVPNHLLISTISELNRLYTYQNTRKVFTFDRETSEVLTLLNNKAFEKNEIKNQIKEVKKAKALEKRQTYYSTQVPLWLTHKNESEIPSDFFPFDMVRTSGNEVETSRGAKVPLQRAFELLRLIELKLPITGLKVGSFEIESEPIDDFIKIGCHKINLTQTKEALKNG